MCLYPGCEIIFLSFLILESFIRTQILLSIREGTSAARVFVRNE